MKKTMMIVVAALGMTIPCLNADAESENTEPLTAQDILIKCEVETAVSMLQAIHAKHEQGELTLEQAKKLGADLLRELRYGKDGYFWADTTEGVNVVLYGKKAVEGKKRIDEQDANGTYYVAEFLSAGNAGGGFIEYLYPKKGETVPQSKRSYVLPFKPFGWIIGSGYYR